MLNFVKGPVDLSFFSASDVLITEKPTIVGIRIVSSKKVIIEWFLEWHGITD